VDSAGSGWDPVAGSCEYGNEPSGSIKGGDGIDQLSDCQLLKKDSAAWSIKTGTVLVKIMHRTAVRGPPTEKQCVRRMSHENDTSCISFRTHPKSI
jgi:hypothetical protein